MRSTAGTIQNWACGVLKSFEKKREDFQNEEKSFERIIMCEHGSNHGSRMRRKQQRDNRQQCSSRQQRSRQQRSSRY